MKNIIQKIKVMVRNKRKEKKIIITDYNMVKIPKEYELIKIASYNINLRNSVHLKNKIDKIMEYILSNYKSKDIDILGIQGIHDMSSIYALVKELKKYAKEHRDMFYFAPNFDFIDSKSESRYIDTHDITSKGSSKTESKSNHKSSRKKSDKTKIQNIIISRYSVVSWINESLDEEVDIDDILGTHTVVGANISIYGNIISVFNTALCPDITSANIINPDVRNKEINTIFSYIEENRENLKTETYRHYVITDIDILMGTFNIDETLNNFGREINRELTDFISNKNCVDVFRYITTLDPGFTNTSKERMNYIFFLLTSDIYEENSTHYKPLKNIMTTDDLFKLLFKRYKIYFIDSYVREDTYVSNSSANFPVESVFMIYKNKH